MNRINRSQKRIKDEGFRFEPFRPTSKNETPLNGARLKEQHELIVFERGDQRRATLMPEMAYHHVCQGSLAGEPYLVTF